MNHPDERILELYLLGSLKGESEHKEISQHLETCEGCEAFFRELSDYHTELKDLLSSQTEDRALQLSSSWFLRPAAKDLARPPKTTAVSGLVRYVVRHPYVSASFGLATLLVIGFILNSFGPDPDDRQPAIVRAMYEDLIVENAFGKELWRKYIGYIHELGDMDDYYARTNFAVATDFDGDGHNEVAHILGWRTDLPLANALACLNSDGSDRWNYALRKNLVLGDSAISDEYRIRIMRVEKFGVPGHPSIVLLGEHLREAPSVLVHLRGDTPTTIGEYWHPGPLPYVRAHDIDSDSVLELLACGKNVSLNKVVLTVLDPMKMDGHAPATPAFTPRNMKAAVEKYYILFPESDLQRLPMQHESLPERVEYFGNGVTRIQVMDRIHTREYYLLYYYFNSSMECDSVRTTPPYEVYHSRMFREGKLNRPVSPEYLEDLRRGVQYWDGERFTTRATMNRKYRPFSLLP